jgi:pimeloyl-ACP methyl ester carboxylesterase
VLLLLALAALGYGIARLTTTTVLLAIVALIACAIGWLAVSCHRAADRWDGGFAYHPDALYPTVYVPIAARATLRVQLDGPDLAPATVVFAHGAGQDLTLWHHQRDALRGSGARLVSYDARGHGDSSYRRSQLRACRPYAEDMGAVIDAVAPAGPLVLVGHGLGALTACTLPTVRPDLLPRIAAAVLINASPRRPRALRRRYLPAMFWALSHIPHHLRARAGDGPYLLLARHLLHRAAKPTVVRQVADSMAFSSLRITGDALAAMAAPDERGGLASVPVVVVTGTDDGLAPPDRKRWTALLPRAEFVALDECGHYAPLEQPHKVTALVRDRLARASVVAAHDDQPHPRPSPRPRPAAKAS